MPGNNQDSYRETLAKQIFAALDSADRHDREGTPVQRYAFVLGWLLGDLEDETRDEIERRLRGGE